MKKISILLFAIIMSTSLFAQDEKSSKDEVKSLFGGTDITHGGYGGIAVNYTQIDGQDAILVGVKGGWIINHGITIGLAGYGFANEMRYDKTINGNTDNYNLAGGYGGLLIEPILWGLKPVHVSIPVLIGAGGATYMDEYWNTYDDPYHSGPYWEESDAFFVLEPGIEIELNMVKFMRIAFGGYYRYTSGLNLQDTKSNVLDGFSTGITLKFGKF